MRTLHKYMVATYLMTFFVTLLVLTFIMCIGIMLRANDLLARGIEWQAIFVILGNAVPAILTFSIPMSVMTSSLLVFGRLSADGEITAMKSCGIGMWSIISRPLLICMFLSALCVYMNNELAPKSHYARRSMNAQLGIERPVDLIEEGRFVQDFQNISMYVGKKEGDHLIDVRIYDMRTPGIKREIRAKGGDMKTTTNIHDMVVELYDVRIDPFPGSDDAGFCGKWLVIVPNALKAREYKKRVEDYSFMELFRRITNVEKYYGEFDQRYQQIRKMLATVEFHKRLALSVSCFAFALLGIPLGIKAHRKESSVGVAMSLFLVFCFYLFIIIAENLARRPEIRSDFIIWLPVVISISLGAYLIERSN